MIYSIDRMLYQLKRSGKLDKLAGLDHWRLYRYERYGTAFWKSIDEVIHDIVKDYDYPVCFNFPVSHGKENYALKIGVTYQIKSW